MSKQTIWEASKLGNLERVRHLIENERVNVNQGESVRRYFLKFLFFFLFFFLILF